MALRAQQSVKSILVLDAQATALRRRSTCTWRCRCSSARPLPPCRSGAEAGASVLSMGRRAALALALCGCSCFLARPAEAIQCFSSLCDDGSSLPCFAPVVAVHAPVDCANAPSVSEYGDGVTARGNPYDACQKIRMVGPSYMGWPPEGDISYRCASTLDDEQDDYHCGECNADGTGCANEYLGIGFDTAMGGKRWLNLRLRCAHL